jgi:hypothetical protein
MSISPAARDHFSTGHERKERSMAAREPVEVINLDIYGNPPLEWSRARNLLDALDQTEVHIFLGTAQPDGKTHAAGIGALWHDGDFYIVSGPKSRKSRNLAANPSCTLSLPMEGLDLVLEGTATRVTDKETLESVAEHYRRVGWPAEVEGDAFTAPYSAPSAGPPPWYVYRFTFDTAVGVAGAEPHGATRWRFAR